MKESTSQDVLVALCGAPGLEQAYKLVLIMPKSLLPSYHWPRQSQVLIGLELIPLKGVLNNSKALSNGRMIELFFTVRYGPEDSQITYQMLELWLPVCDRAYLCNWLQRREQRRAFQAKLKKHLCHYSRGA